VLTKSRSDDSIAVIGWLHLYVTSCTNHSVILISHDVMHQIRPITILFTSSSVLQLAPQYIGIHWKVNSTSQGIIDTT